MKQKANRLAALTFALCLTAATSRAATIVYNFSAGDALVDLANNAPDSATSAATSNDFGSGITASVWTATSPVGEIGISGGRMVAVKKVDTDSHTFTITIPNLVNATVNLTSLSFDYGNVGADTSPANFTVTTGLVGGTITPNTATHAAGPANASVNMVLAGTFTGLNNTSITFTLADSAGGNNNTLTLHTFIDNVVLTGVIVPVPEPRAALLGGLGLLMLLRRRR